MQGYIADGPTPVGAIDRRGGPSRCDGRSQVVLIFRIIICYILTFVQVFFRWHDVSLKTPIPEGGWRQPRVYAANLFPH